MTIQEMIERKRELGYSNEHLSELTGVPIPTIQKIFSGKTKSPRMATIRALEAALSPSRRLSGDLTEVVKHEFPGTAYQEQPFGSHSKKTADLYGTTAFLPDHVSEPQASFAAKKKEYTIEDIYALPEGVRAELIDGQIYYMGSPGRIHQEIIGELHVEVANYIRSHGGPCKVYESHLAVFLFGDNSTYVEPDLSVVCNPDKLDDRGCVGAPDWIVEVLSPSSGRMDCIVKLIKYRTAGVREYWIVDPKMRTIATYRFSGEEEEEQVEFYSFDDKVPCSLFPELQIRLSEFV